MIFYKKNYSYYINGKKLLNYTILKMQVFNEFGLKIDSLEKNLAYAEIELIYNSRTYIRNLCYFLSIIDIYQCDFLFKGPSKLIVTMYNYYNTLFLKISIEKITNYINF